MGFFDGFPFTNTHQLNLDWIIGKLKSVESVSDDAKAAIERANSAVERANSAVNIAENAASNSQHYSEQAAGIVQTLYGVGSIYISTNHISPALFFGGSWERIEGRFLVGASAAYSNGSTGGEATHTLTIDEMPRHKHEIPFPALTAVDQAYTWGSENFRGADDSHWTEETGGGQPHNNMPPYLAVYMWKRVA